MTFKRYLALAGDARRVAVRVDRGMPGGAVVLDLVFEGAAPVVQDVLVGPSKAHVVGLVGAGGELRGGGRGLGAAGLE